MARLPVWFLAHGAPIHAIEDTPLRRFWQGLPQRLPEVPRAVLCLSAHWLADRPTLAGGVAEPTIQYDFHGFPEALYRLKWPLPDATAAGLWLKERLQRLLGEVDDEADRPLDHGVWAPLLPAWPQPPFPVLQLTLCPQRDAAWHWRLGQQLRPLRDEGVLIVTSGGLVHNLSLLDRQARWGEAEPWATEFMEVVESAIERRDQDTLCHPWSLPHGQRAVPTNEHYLPLLCALGCSHKSEPFHALFRGWEHGNLALHSYGVSP